jgi:hypothetical protein
VIVTTHSPLFCDAVLREADSLPKKADVAMLNVRREPGGTQVQPFYTGAPLFKDSEIAKALTADREDGPFESLMLRGLLDG